MPEQDSINITGVKEIAEKKLAGFRVVAQSMEEFGQEIPKASLALVDRKNEIKQLVQPVKLIGAFKAAETSEAEDGYWVCFEVNDFEDVPEDMVTFIVPAQKYAVLNFRGHASEIVGVYSHLHQWIEENDYKRSPVNWTLEIYSKWTENEDNVDLCDPIE
ncbi:GyrI-like domain-containing protein [Virgibacillus doumboii]|uniref:GyrI-like domain-containing protein n=1 Tax=Virgibacillus doumboii TaxID=2697503 RepID=UPI0013DF1803|nr:GyrI-like domain-containing protein [Virgibacillus doumboii]